MEGLNPRLNAGPSPCHPQDGRYFFAPPANTSEAYLFQDVSVAAYPAGTPFFLEVYAAAAVAGTSSDVTALMLQVSEVDLVSPAVNPPKVRPTLRRRAQACQQPQRQPACPLLCSGAQPTAQCSPPTPCRTRASVPWRGACAGCGR